jgi:exonuclease III
MKLVALNVWGGRIHDPLMAFLKTHSEVDFFCFQEVYHDAEGKEQVWGGNFGIFGDIVNALPSHNPFFHPHLGDWWGLGSFVKKSITVSEEGETYVFKEKGYSPELEVLGYTAKNLQYIKTQINGKLVTIVNFHGLWNGKGKNDTEDRLEQSRNIVSFIKTISGPVVLCGDFNLLPETESLQMISRELGYRDLISEYGITSTRTSLYTKPNKYADYVFVSPEIIVENFAVLPDEVSDHAPLFLEFSVQ